MTSFNLVDIVFIIILLASTLLAFWKGFVAQAISFTGWILALLAARLLGQEVAPVFEPLIPDPGLQLAAAYISVTLVVLLAARVVSAALGSLVAKIGLGMLDKLLGIAFGILRGLAIIVLGVAIASLTEVRHHSLWQESRLMPFMEQVRDYSAAHLDDYISRIRPEDR